MSTLLDYLNHLDANATAIAAHNADPAAAMTQFGLSTVEQQILLSGDMAAIASLVGIDARELPKVNVTNIDDTY
jgi:hypothetical protein